MRRLAVLLLIACPAVASAQTKDGFVPLFNGKNLDGWEVRSSAADKEKWSAQDGILVAKPGGGWIGTTKMYGHFILKVEWKIFAGGNSGVFLRVPDVKSKESPSYLGLEIQILDDDAPQHKGKLKPYQYCGGLYHFQGVSKKMSKPVEQWNAYEITCKGEFISVVFNRYARRRSEKPLRLSWYSVSRSTSPSFVFSSLSSRSTISLICTRNHGSMRVS